ncbi:MAG: hypothetical protein AAB877_02855, partial [Patescibacteria group bacterium]
MTKEKDNPAKEQSSRGASKETPAEKDSAPAINVGSIVEGKIVARDRSAVFIDLGPQGTVIIYGREFYAVKDSI